MILHERRDLAAALNDLGPRLGEVAEPFVGVLSDPVGEFGQLIFSFTGAAAMAMRIMGAG
jgi:hypothetical protein